MSDIEFKTNLGERKRKRERERKRGSDQLNPIFVTFKMTNFEEF